MLRCGNKDEEEVRMTLLTTAEEISDIAFGFMGSKALFAALHYGVFTELAEGPQEAEALAEACGLPPERARTLLTALASLGLVSVEDGRFANAPAAEAFLVRGAKYDFGDYLRLQVDRQMYRLLDQIEPALANRLPEEATGSYADWFSDPEQARIYSESQHAGSLGPARGLAKLADLSKARRLLDVGGGTGAYAITLCEAWPELTATVVDFPNVAALGRRYVDEAKLSNRIRYIEGNALETPWPEGQDAVLMSYLFSGVPGEAHDRLIADAWRVLEPGGTVMIHDFIVEAERTGPKLAALWQLQHTAFTPEARSLDDAWLAGALRAAGFEDVTVQPMIPGMTMLAMGRRPGEKPDAA
jgi:ubiquinone/menaquinone biosynthesis C-methylase UbiE